MSFIAAAEALRSAYVNGPISPMRDVLHPTDEYAAYSIQTLNTRHWQNSGRRVVGRKIGLTSLAVQKQLGVDRPDFGVLFDDMAITDQGALRASLVLQPKVEAEVALIMARDLSDPQATIEDVIAATAYASAAIEIVDSRIADWKITYADTVADNGSSAFYVIGEERKQLRGLDLYTCGMALEINGEVASLGAGAACLGHPLNAAVWLVRTLAEFGEGLHAGDVVLTGALGPMAPIKPGDRVLAKIGGMGAVSFQFENDC